jgi:hypothetical protein
VPIVWKFWKPQLPVALIAWPGLQWDSSVYLAPLQLNGEQKKTGVSNIVRGILIIGLYGRFMFDKFGFKVFQ